MSRLAHRHPIAVHRRIRNRDRLFGSSLAIEGFDDTSLGSEDVNQSDYPNADHRSNVDIRLEYSFDDSFRGAVEARRQHRFVGGRVDQARDADLPSARENVEGAKYVHVEDLIDVGLGERDLLVGREVENDVRTGTSQNLKNFSTIANVRENQLWWSLATRGLKLQAQTDKRRLVRVDEDEAFRIVLSRKARKSRADRASGSRDDNALSRERTRENRIRKQDFRSIEEEGPSGRHDGTLGTESINARSRA